MKTGERIYPAGTKACGRRHADVWQDREDGMGREVAEADCPRLREGLLMGLRKGTSARLLTKFIVPCMVVTAAASIGLVALTPENILGGDLNAEARAFEPVYLCMIVYGAATTLVAAMDTHRRKERSLDWRLWFGLPSVGVALLMMFLLACLPFGGTSPFLLVLAKCLLAWPAAAAALLAAYGAGRYTEAKNLRP